MDKIIEEYINLDIINTELLFNPQNLKRNLDKNSTTKEREIDAPTRPPTINPMSLVGPNTDYQKLKMVT